MKTLAHHLAHVRSRPPHIRKQVAFALAAGATALIALFWLVISLATGAFHIEDTPFADAASAGSSATASASGSSLLGSALSAFSGTTSPAQLQVVNANSGAAAAVPPASANTQTVIPF